MPAAMTPGHGGTFRQAACHYSRFIARIDNAVKMRRESRQILPLRCTHHGHVIAEDYRHARLRQSYFDSFPSPRSSFHMLPGFCWLGDFQASIAPSLLAI